MLPILSRPRRRVAREALGTFEVYRWGRTAPRKARGEGNMIEERDANPTPDTPARFRGRRAPTPLTAGGTESSEAVARLSGTESSNPLPRPRKVHCELSDFVVSGNKPSLHPHADRLNRVTGSEH